MKPQQIQTPPSNSFKLLSLASGLLLCLLVNSANANWYWDINGATAGAGGATPSGSWEAANWTTSSAGTIATVAWTEGQFPRFAAGTDATGSYTITANSDHHMVGMLRSGGTSGAILTFNGTGTLFIDGGVQQGFFAQANCFMRINNKLSGTGGVICQSGQLYLDGNNDYNGGTTPNGLINFNNANSFGTGPLIISVSGSALIPEGSSAITIGNPWTVSVTGSINCVGLAAGITYSGNISLGANTLAFGCGGGTGALDTFSGIISGTGGIGRQVSASHGTIIFSGANTYTGKTSLQSSVTQVSSINSVATPAPQASSNFGVPANAANGTLAFGSTTFTGTLLYTGAGETTDRVIDLAGTTGGGTIQNDGAGALIFTSINTASVAGAKTLTLQGSNTGANSIGKLVDSSSGATSVAKAGAGTWKLTGANTYTGSTTLNGGALEISGSVAGNVTNISGTLSLDSASTLASSAALAISSGTTVNLNFTGTNSINVLVIDGSPQVSGVWGPTSSTAPNTSSIFQGTGFINVLGKPQVVQQPVSGSVFLGDNTLFTFSVGVAGDLSTMTYQWKRNGANIAGATDSSYLIPSPVAGTSAGAYSCGATNAYGGALSASANLFVMNTNNYTQMIRGITPAAIPPIAYWRLDETNGTAAFDTIGGNNGVYLNANLNQPGFSVVAGSDPGIGIPSAVAQKGYVIVSNATPFSFPSLPFTMEAWAMSTNFGGKQRLISTLTLSGAGGYGFTIRDNQHLQLTPGGGSEVDAPLPSSLASGEWYHFVVTCDAVDYVFYLNGLPFYTQSVTGHVLPASPGGLGLGNNPFAYPTEQLYGGLDEVAIYNYALDVTTVTNHYLARYSDLAAPTVSTPIANPPTNYVSLSSSINAVAGGVGLTYQWYKGTGFGSPVSGGTDSILTISPLHLSDAASYHVFVTDAASHTADSPLAYLGVVPIPTTAAELHLTNGLIVHLPFDSDYQDISGRNNHGANVGATTFVTPGVVGAKAVHYSSGPGSFNYVTLGVRPDLQFGDSSTGPDFTVSYWVRGTANLNLPFFCDATGGQTGVINLAGGFYFGPNTTANGSWAFGLGSAAHESTSSGTGVINDGNWHNLVHVAKRTGNMTTYVDGVQADVHAIGFVSDSVNTANPANIGQDGTGAMSVSTQGGDIDDFAVWTRTLTQFEVSGIFLAGISNSVSVAPAPVSATTITSITSTTLTYSGGSGQHFVLLGTNDVSAPLATWPRLLTNNSTGGTFTLPASPSSSMFYRVSSEN